MAGMQNCFSCRQRDTGKRSGIFEGVFLIDLTRLIHDVLLVLPHNFHKCLCNNSVTFIRRVQTIISNPYGI